MDITTLLGFALIAILTALTVGSFIGIQTAIKDRDVSLLSLSAWIFNPLFFFFLLPVVLGNLFAFLIWAFFGSWPNWMVWYPVGMLFSGIIGKNVVDELFTEVKKAYVLEHWFDGIFSKKEAALQFSKGLHGMPFWWTKDATTIHERDILIVVGTQEKPEIFETIRQTKNPKGKNKKVNLYVYGATLSLEVPEKDADKLRKLGSTMAEIKDQLEGQLRPTLIDSMKRIIGTSDPDDIQVNSDESGASVSNKITQRFIDDIFLKNGRLSCLDKYGVDPYTFALGQTDFSKEMLEARERAAAMSEHTDAADDLVEKSKAKGEKMSFERSMEFVHGHQDPGSLKIDKQHITFDSNLDPETVRALGKAGEGIASVASSFAAAKGKPQTKSKTTKKKMARKKGKGAK
jgi:hypothetical protein